MISSLRPGVANLLLLPHLLLLLLPTTASHPDSAHTRAWLQADIDKAAEWKSKTVAGWWADMQKVASFKGKAAEVTVGEMTDEVPVADLVNQAFEDMEKKKAEEKNVFGSFDNADSDQHP
ncbi:unnamed protein product [Fusarium graminearum]|uniref:Chromosome 2, complete genome n=1 Tax=Gibberella zeae (strain ATCC MYA-4620 / CBS 123657 / FGSC 9075 / NRRL 31084 / PH-1) TaxID=229533 RepID=A0A098DGE3_GIBZE|nr:unnamed protein product [Fusarium graminearum]